MFAFVVRVPSDQRTLGAFALPVFLVVVRGLCCEFGNVFEGACSVFVSYAFAVFIVQDVWFFEFLRLVVADSWHFVSDFWVGG